MCGLLFETLPRIMFVGSSKQTGSKHLIRKGEEFKMCSFTKAFSLQRFIDENAFRDLKILVELDLTKNNITKLRPRTFDGNDGLQLIKFAKNPIAVLQVRPFPGLRVPETNSLTLASFEFCNVTPFCTIFPQLKNAIDISGTRTTFDVVARVVADHCAIITYITICTYARIILKFSTSLECKKIILTVNSLFLTFLMPLFQTFFKLTYERVPSVLMLPATSA